MKPASEVKVGDTLLYIPGGIDCVVADMDPDYCPPKWIKVDIEGDENLVLHDDFHEFNLNEYN